MTSERLIALTSELGSLSEKYGFIHFNEHGTLISNDEGYLDIFPRLQNQLAKTHGGVGIVVGSGGVLSQLPELPVDCVIMLDVNRAVLEFNRLVAGLVADSSTENEVLGKLVQDDFIKRSGILKKISYFESDLSTGFLREEAIVYGDKHWTNPSRLGLVRDALKKKPIVYVAADITDPGFGNALTDTLAKYNEKITYVNFSNVHTWVVPTKRDFIKQWPLAHDPAILFSTSINALVGDYPRMQVAKRVKEYLNTVRLDFTENISHGAF